MIIYQHWYDTRINFTFLDVIFLLLIFTFAFIYAKNIKDRKVKTESYYKYFPQALMLKFFAGIVFAVITMAFYPGDTFEYFISVNSLNKLFYLDTSKYFDVLLNGNIPEYQSYFNYETGYPSGYMWRDPNAVFVWRAYSPFLFFTSNNFVASSVIAALISFSGLWKLYRVFCDIYPKLEKQFAIAILYFPSVLFWSGGILKDTLTLAAIGWIVYSFYFFAIKRRFKLRYILVIIVGSIVIINIKSYIFAALLPGLLIWLFFGQLKNIKTGLVKFIIAPLLISAILIVFSLIMTRISTKMGEYGDLDKSLKKAQITQQDLTRSEQYGENYYDIGEFEATPTGVLSKAPIATISGIFRPFIWEARNPFVLLAGIESLFLMLFSFYTIYKTGLLKTFKNIFTNPILIFSFSFILIFGFGVGLATANFGALVRYKIPLLPFLTAGLFILIEMSKKKNEIADQIIEEKSTEQTP
jgi:hypothetical protein